MWCSEDHQTPDQHKEGSRTAWYTCLSSHWQEIHVDRSILEPFVLQVVDQGCDRRAQDWNQAASLGRMDRLKGQTRSKTYVLHLNKNVKYSKTGDQVYNDHSMYQVIVVFVDRRFLYWGTLVSQKWPMNQPTLASLHRWSFYTVWVDFTTGFTQCHLLFPLTTSTPVKYILNFIVRKKQLR